MAKALDWTRDGTGWPNRSASRFVAAGGYHWHVQRAGQGPALLLLHGTGASTHSWADLFPRLAERFDTLAVDLPGHGFTRALSSRRPSLPAMTEALAALLAEEGFAAQVIAGHSAGAAIAVSLAISAGPPAPFVIGLNAALEPLNGLAGLVGPAMANALRLNPFVPGLLARSARDPRRVARLIAGTGSQVPDAYLADYSRLFRSPAHIAGTLAMMASWDLSGLMQRCERAGVRVHLIAGANDKAVSPESATGLARQFGGVTAEILPGLGHLAHEEDARRVAEAVLRAIEGAGAAGRRRKG